MENTNSTFKVIIESGPEGITYSLETNGPVLTRELVGVFEMCKLMAYEKKIPQEEVKQVKVCNGIATIIDATREVKIRDDEHLSVRARNALYANDIETLEDLLRCSATHVMLFRNLGKHTLKEIELYVLDKGYSFGCLSPIWVPWGACGAIRSDSRSAIPGRNFNTTKDRDAFISQQNEIIRQRERGLL